MHHNFVVMLIKKSLKTNVIDFASILTMSVNAAKFPEEVNPAFEKLESKIVNKKGRKFFGAISFNNDFVDYKACLVPAYENEHLALGFDEFIIPGGKYVTTKLIDWSNNTKKIKYLFEEMENKYKFDAMRPQLEFYKNNKELILMLPIIPREEQLKFNFDC